MYMYDFVITLFCRDSDMGFHVKQDITVFRPYHNNYAFFMR